MTLCFAILVKLNVYSLDMRALKKVTRHMKTLGCGREQLRGPHNS